MSMTVQTVYAPAAPIWRPRNHKRAAARTVPLTRRPLVGTQVRLLSHDPFLSREHGASAGAIGRIVEHSRLNTNDTGVFVDWGDGRRVRSNLGELGAA